MLHLQGSCGSTVSKGNNTHARDLLVRPSHRRPARETGLRSPCGSYQQPSARASPRASGARNRSAPARIVAPRLSNLRALWRIKPVWACHRTTRMPRRMAAAMHVFLRYCALHRYDDRNCSTELLTENRNRRHIESYASSIKASSTYSRQAYSVRAGRWEPSKGPKSWAYEVCHIRPTWAQIQPQVLMARAQQLGDRQQPCADEMLLHSRFGTLAEAQMACELMARQSADSCTGSSKMAGFSAWVISGGSTLMACCPRARLWPRRLRAAVGVYGLLRSLCGVPLILAAIEPEDDLFAQLSYDSADHSRRAEASVALQQLAKRAVSFEVHDFRVTDQDEATSRCFDRAYAEQGDHYVGALLTGDRVRNHCRALALLFQLARAIETVGSSWELQVRRRRGGAHRYPLQAPDHDADPTARARSDGALFAELGGIQ